MQEGLVKCPYCAEEIKAEALICKHCGQNQAVQIKKRKDEAARIEKEKKARELQTPKIIDSKTGRVVCTKCGNEYFVAFDAHNVMRFKCSRCGHNNRRESTSDENFAIFTKYVPIVIVMLCSFLLLRSCMSGFDKVDKYDAYYAATQFVERRLKAPATAEFSGYDKEQVYNIKENVYRISGYVDAENGFGARIRRNYSCKIVYIPERNSWRCEYVSFDE